MRRPRSGGGWKAIGYSLKLAHRVGFWNMWKAMRSKNTCKTCAVGMGGQLGGMVNEGGHFPEVCKKSFQAMASDMQGALRTDVIEKTEPQSTACDDVAAAGDVRSHQRTAVPCQRRLVVQSHDMGSCDLRHLSNA